MSYNASSTYMSFLMHSNDGVTYEKLIDIKNYPDMGGDPELIDTTTLSDKMRTGVPGIIELDTLTFDANYDPADYTKCNTQAQSDLAGASYYAVWFGGTENANGDPTPTGSLGKFAFKGKMTVYVTGGDVNAARAMRISIAAATPISLVSADGVAISLDKYEVSIVDGNTAALVATATAGATVKWSSSDTSVATVSNGTVTAVDPGNAIITATATKDGAIAYTTCSVTVTAS